MSDPRFTDPRFNDPVHNRPVLNRGESVGGVWGWIAGLGVIALIAFIIIAGWNGDGPSTATNSPVANPPVTTGSAPVRNVTPPTTTGSGATSPAPSSTPPAR